MIKRIFTLWGLLFCFNSVIFSQTFPTGFSTTDIGSGWVSPTVATFTPDGQKLFVTEKRGRVYVCIRNGSGTYIKQTTPVLNIEEEVGNWRDFGMLGFALDPNFATNGYIYVMYVVDRHHLLYYGTGSYNSATNEYFNATIGRITRYQTSTVAGSLIANPASRTILVGETKQTGIPILYESHGTGALGFAPDGTLLASTGDGASYIAADGGSRSETYYAQALADGIIRSQENVGAFRAQMINSLSGKLLRINPATGDGISSNPFYDPAAPRSAKSRVWALGLRNPFRFMIKPGTGSTNPATGDIGEIYVGDVGYNIWEELNIINEAGANCGWPLYEGQTQLSDYDNLTTQNLDEPNPLYNGGSCNRPYFRFKELLKQATADNINTVYNPCNSAVAIGTGNRYFHLRPSLDWNHTANNARAGIFNGNNASEATIGTVASGVIGSPFKGNCSVAGCWYDGTTYPANYRNTFFQADYGAGWLKSFSVDFVDKIQKVQDFGSGFAAIVCVTQNPLDGTLVYIDIGSNVVRNINYGGNQLPVVVMTSDKTFGPSTLNVSFNSSSSYDPDGTIASRIWDFGDGSPTNSTINPAHDFTATPGVPTKYVVKLTVSDNSGGISVDSIIISVNNTPPVVNITSPVKNSLYTLGPDTAYTLAATVTDTEHPPGQLKYEWQTILRHNNHQHPELIDTSKNTTSIISRIGCNGDTYYWEIKLKVTDAAGLSASDSSFIYPTVIPYVSISSNQGNTICSAAQIIFTATPTNGGSSPSYQWKLNGNNVGTNSNQYQNSSLANGDIVTCVLTSNAQCANPAMVTSNAITMTVNGQVTPSVSIIANPGNSICSGTLVTFTATPTNGGATPSYQWKLNGSNVGSNSNQYQNISLTNGDIVTCILTSSANCAIPTTTTSNAVTMTVNTIVTPSVSVVANPGNIICSGSQVTFTATPTNGGSTPSYQWKLNGNNVGTNSNQYQNVNLTNGDIVICALTSSAICANPTTATSNVISMSVTPSVTPSINITVNPGNSICSGTLVTFTATSTNGGATPSYQWKLNGINAGTNSSQYQNSGLVNGDIVTCVLTSSIACSIQATSNAITMTATAQVTPSVNIAASPGNTICSGTQVTFSATPTNGGTTPSYQWKLNGNNVGINSNQYQNAGLASGDIVTCVLTSSLACASPGTATSNAITMAITALITPSVSIAADPGGSICSGTQVTFTATPTNGGAAPSYQWKLNGNNVGTNSNQYQNAAFGNGDIITCVLTSSGSCANPTTTTSNAITMAITPVVTPSVTIIATTGNTICAGTQVTFIATPTNGGTSPSYQWKRNGNNVGTNSNQYQSVGIANGDIVTCILTSNVNCGSPTTATSNALSMTVNAIVIPSVSIAASTGNTICSGTQVIFTATPTNGGTSPSYQWKLNGNNVGTNNNQYQNTALANGDIVTCALLSNANCANPITATSNAVIMTVNALLIPTVSITANPGNTICSGTQVIFTATPSNGGTAPSYQWKLNGNNVGTNSNQYTNAGLVNGDIITCIMTSNANCASPATVLSNAITMTVKATVIPSVSIVSDLGNSICSGTLVLFLATPTNGGSTPSYQWKLNGNNVSGIGAIYATENLIDGEIVECDITSNANCANPSTVLSNSITMRVTASITPSVSIVANPGNTICSGSNVTFTATPTNGGSAPSYQWKLNGEDVGTNSNQYLNAGLADGDVVECLITSNASSCASRPTTAISNAVTMTVNAIVTPSISIVAVPGNTICSGSNVLFTATPINGGTTPSYQWKLNGNNVGTNSDQYQNAGLSNGDVVTCVLTSNANCANPANATSNAIRMEVNSLVAPSLTIVANPGNIICSGTRVTFTATPTNGGSTPSYQWKLNGNNVGTNNDTYQSTSLTDGDIITCQLTSSFACANPATSISNAITMTVNALVIPSVNIVAVPGNTICSGTEVTFSASPTNRGSAPSYQWKLNGNNVGTNSDHYQTTALMNGDIVTCVLTSNAVCASPATATSNTISMSVNTTVTPTINISANPGSTICSGTQITFSANQTNGGTTPSYQWKLNGNNVGINSNQYQNTGLENGDNVICEMTSNAVCVSAVSATSNVLAITINKAPSILVPPGNLSTVMGSNANFVVVASGNALTYQWRKEGINIPSATNSTYSIANVAIEDAGDYDVVVSGSCPPTVTSNMAILAVSAITSQPTNQTVCTGSNASFSITASGTALTYQWQVSTDGAPFININGATTNTLNLDAVTNSLNGNQYRCVINGILISNAGKLKVNPLPVVSLTLPFDTLYQNSSIQTLSGGNPGGGLYSGNGVIAGKFNPVANQQGKHLVEYKYTDANGCASMASDEFAIIAPDIGVNVYPNPALNGVLTIVTSPDLVGSNVTAFNSFGQIISSWKIGGRMTTYHLHWTAGIYMLQFSQGTKTVSKRFMIIR